MKVEDKLIKIRNELSQLSKSILEDFKSYSEPPVCEYLNSACSELDQAIMSCTKE